MPTTAASTGSTYGARCSSVDNEVTAAVEVYARLTDTGAAQIRVETDLYEGSSCNASLGGSGNGGTSVSFGTSGRIGYRVHNTRAGYGDYVDVTVCAENDSAVFFQRC